MTTGFIGKTFTLALLGGAVVLGAAVAATVTVDSASVKLRGEPNQFNPMIAEAPRGSTLEVLETQGGFQKVKFGEKIGWIRTADLTRKAFAVPGAGASAYASGAAAGSASEAASEKGLTPAAEEYARERGINTAALERLVQQRERIVDSGEYTTFAQEGNVGKR